MDEGKYISYETYHQHGMLSLSSKKPKGKKRTMEKSTLLSASGVLFLVALAVFVFSFFYYHYANEKGLLGKTFHKKPTKPFVSFLFGILGTVILASSIISLVFWLVGPRG